MAISYYDEAITQKIKNWLADSSKLRVFSPDESSRLIQLMADDSKDKPITLPVITISRNKDIELESAIKQNKSFDGFIIDKDASTATTVHMNVIPIKTTYQLDIYTKKRIEADEYVRQYLFKLINNPQIIIEIPYPHRDNCVLRHTANIRVLNTISDTSDIPTHVFAGQFYKWTIQLELQDGFLFSVPRRRNWRFVSAETKLDDKVYDLEGWPDKDEPTNDSKPSINDSDADIPNGAGGGDWEEILCDCPKNNLLN
jgi:hypothetical protein